MTCHPIKGVQQVEELGTMFDIAYARAEMESKGGERNHDSCQENGLTESDPESTTDQKPTTTTKTTAKAWSTVCMTAGAFLLGVGLTLLTQFVVVQGPNRTAQAKKDSSDSSIDKAQKDDKERSKCKCTKTKGDTITNIIVNQQVTSIFVTPTKQKEERARGHPFALAPGDLPW